ncbi:unnamed protein product [Heligmosomoides polygyrus]|uniref:Uncharacterized protein n=1 Tax=Heligmosomoides polygyrus TaxID=6339 RepID=A0A183GBX8_HELPZ|nr:unnamed protein product [Heligmosomoides polygyrus]
MDEDEDMQLCKAHERIRTLNRELLLQDDTSAQARATTGILPWYSLRCSRFQIAALRKKIALSKDRAQGILSMANKRIAYLHDLWKEPSQRELKMTDVKSSSMSVLKVC